MANVLSKRPITNVSETIRMIGNGEWDACDHVRNGEPPVSVACEDDSFGPVCRWVMCKTCDEACRKEVSEQKHVCRGCKGSFAKSEGLILWKWYDFYAEQGDEPIPVCKECQSKAAHQERVRKDREDYQWEFGNNHDDDGDWPDDSGRDDCSEDDEEIDYEILWENDNHANP